MAIGTGAGEKNQGISAISLGTSAGNKKQGKHSIAIGYNAGQENQFEDSISIGNSSGRINQGKHSIAIGYKAGERNQVNNTIIINATNDQLNCSDYEAGCYIKPIACEPKNYKNNLNQLYYDVNTGQLFYKDNNCLEHKIKPCILSHKEPSGTDGGSTIARTWNKIKINHFKNNIENGIKVNNNNEIIFINEGTYYITFSSLTYNSGDNVARIISINHNTKIINGIPSYSGSGLSTGSGVLKLEKHEKIKLEHYTKIHNETGLGKSLHIEGYPETYAQITIQKI